MRKITFIGNTNTEFASRYNREVAPKLVFEGQQLEKFLGKNKNLTASDLKDIENVKNELRFAGEKNRFFKYMGVKTGENWSKGYSNRYTAEQSNGLVPKEYRKQRIEQLKAEAEKRKPKSSQKTNTQSTPKPTNSAPKVASNNTTKTPTPLLQSKPKLGMKGKLGLGAVGLLGAGAIGYGIYRKVRSDKGKKRR